MVSPTNVSLPHLLLASIVSALDSKLLEVKQAAGKNVVPPSCDMNSNQLLALIFDSAIVFVFNCVKLIIF
jgi:hypothetical protein